MVYSWQERTDVPGLGHYLFIRDGETFDILPDALYDVALFEGKGGLSLRNVDGDVVDRFGWGGAPEDFFSESPVIDFISGDSFERLPGGESGNGTISGNNAADIMPNSEPNPQNTGSLPRPLNDERLAIMLDFPEAIPPGKDFDFAVIIKNLSSEGASEVKVSLPLANHLSVIALPQTADLVDGRVIWNIDSIDAGDTVTSILNLTSPFANLDTLIGGYYADSANLPRAYGELKVLQMDGSAIPIDVARSLPEGSVVTVEGVVTMYPGGFFAGSDSAKFYLEDETGGVQIFADGGRFDISVNIGNRVRVTGQTELFRDSLEVIPQDNVNDIEVLPGNNQVPEPTTITILDNEANDDVLGRLNTVEGTADRIDEFTFHYEIDLKDEVGNQTQIFIEKDTGISADPLRLGSLYRITGISEMASGVRQLRPRLQSDFVEIFPPILMLEAEGPNNILPGETMTVTLTATNHTDGPMTGVRIVVDGEDGNDEEWLIPRLEGDGVSESVNYIIQVPEDAAGIVDMGSFSVVSDQWIEPALALPHETFIGQGVPIWAIQGDGSRSPLIGQKVTAVGVVTGDFPEMDGFFLQSLEPDGNPDSSDGIFVSTENLGHKVGVGEIVGVSGRVREDGGQTILRPAIPSDIIIQNEGNNILIEPIVYDPPADPLEAKQYKESLEGMLVTMNVPATVIAPTNRFGEYAVVSNKWNTDLVRRRDGPVGFVIWIDDGTFNSYDDQSNLPVAVARGDAVKNVVGPLAYTFGNFKIAPIELPEFEQVLRPLPTIPESAKNQFSMPHLI